MDWTQVNDITWKLTDADRVISTGLGLGMKGGYGATRALAWVINVGWPAHRGAWYVRIGEKSAGPFSVVKAKRVAEAILAGDPDVQGFAGVLDLNGLAGKVLDDAVPSGVRAPDPPRILPDLSRQFAEAELLREVEVATGVTP